MPSKIRKLVRHMAVIGQILGWSLAVLLGLIIASFAIDTVLRRDWKAKTAFDQEGPTASRQLVVVFPGAFSRAKFQFEPIAAGLKRTPRMLYVENIGKRYSLEATITETVKKVKDLVATNPAITRIDLIGSSMGAAVAAKTGVELRKRFPHLKIDLIVVDGVGRPDDLRQPNWVFGLMGWLPFGPIWDRLGFLNLVIQPSSEKPDANWADHAKQGLAMVRSIPTAFWGDQMRELGSIRVTAEELASFDCVTYVSSSQDEAILKPEESLTYWRGLVPQEKFRWQVIPAGHTAYEMKPRDYLAAIEQALAT